MTQDSEKNSSLKKSNIFSDNQNSNVNGQGMSETSITQSGYVSQVYNGWRSLGLKKQVILLAIAGSSLPVFLISLANSVWQTTPLALVLEISTVSLVAG